MTITAVVTGDGLPALLTLLVAAIIWVFNAQMTAESLFKEPGTLAFKPRAGNVLDEGSLVIGVEHKGAELRRV